MKRLEPVIWAKGTFLTPQHLQIQDRFLENTLQFHLDSLTFRPVGISPPSGEPGATAGRNVRAFERVGHLSGRPAVRHPEFRSGTRSQTAGRDFGTDQEEVAVYLAIPQYRERGLNISPPSAGCRYALPGGGGDIQGREHRASRRGRCRWRARISASWWKARAARASSSLRVGSVRRTEAGHVSIESAFRSAAGGFHGQRLSGVDCAAVGGDPFGAKQRCCPA